MNIKNEYWDNFRFRSNNHSRLFYWSLLLNKRKNHDLELGKQFHHWVYSSDDVLNKLLKLCVFSLYCYGTYVFILEIRYKFF